MKTVKFTRIFALFLAVLLMCACASCGDNFLEERELQHTFDRVGIMLADEQSGGYVCTYYGGAMVELYNDNTYVVDIEGKHYEGDYSERYKTIDIELIDGYTTLYYFTGNGEFIVAPFEMTDDIWSSVRFA